MDLQGYRDEIKFKLSGGVLDLELDDSAIDRLINSSLREIQRYIDSIIIKTIPYSPCIDLSPYKVSAVTNVFRAESFTGNSGASPGEYGAGISMVDPMYASQWQLVSGTGNMYNFQDFVYNYSAWNTLLQIRNTTSTDMQFVFDKASSKLYVNVSAGRPQNITIAYVPRYDDVSQIVSDYWIDMLLQLAVALAKVTLGRIRTRFTQSNALWTQDGQQLLDEGNTELNDIREKLKSASQLCYPID